MRWSATTDARCNTLPSLQRRLRERGRCWSGCRFRSGRRALGRWQGRRNSSGWNYGSTFLQQRGSGMKSVTTADEARVKTRLELTGVPRTEGRVRQIKGSSNIGRHGLSTWCWHSLFYLRVYPCPDASFDVVFAEVLRFWKNGAGWV